MDAVTLLGSTLGLGTLAGIRLYATVLVVGLAVHFGWYHPPAALSGLTLLGEPYVLGASAVGVVMEFLADKVPLVDSLWDSIHTVVRPFGAIALAAIAVRDIDPGWRLVIALLSGGAAFTTHAAKSSTRVAVNHSPEPFSNWFVSLVEDALVPAGVWAALAHPIVALVLALLLIAASVWVVVTTRRLVRRGHAAVRRLFSRERAPQ